uniref:helix-turn-helix domain-containing protein n=1 Tax=Paracoccus sp. TRP TaxID=412597 RepID=UPI00110FBA6A|nr:helix-turn-helix domain-containing protein [Paracoccus sp. TRP]
MPKIMVAVDSDALAEIHAKLDALSAKIDAVRVAPVPEWMPAGEYAKLAGVTRRTVMNWIAAGRIESSRHGATVMVRANPGA